METPTAKRCAKVRRFSGNANLFWGKLTVLSCQLTVHSLQFTVDSLKLSVRVYYYFQNVYDFRPSTL